MRPQSYRLKFPLTSEQVESIDTMFETLFREQRRLASPRVAPLAGTKVYYVADTSGGAVTRKLTFTDGILTADT